MLQVLCLSMTDIHEYHLDVRPDWFRSLSAVFQLLMHEMFLLPVTPASCQSHVQSLIPNVSCNGYSMHLLVKNGASDKVTNQKPTNVVTHAPPEEGGGGAWMVVMCLT